MSGYAITRLSALLTLVLVLAACPSAPSRIQPEITFAGSPQIGLDVARIEIVQRYQSTLSDPYVEHLFPKEPAQVIRRWAEDRLVARGTSGTATLIIVNAGVTEEVLARDPGFRGLVTIEQSERYEAEFAVRLEIDQPATRSTGVSNALARRSITAPENASLADREQIWFDLTENTVRDLDAKFEQEVTAGLPQFLVR